MRFAIEQRFRASAEVAVRAFASIDYLVNGMSKLSDIGVPTVQSQDVTKKSVHNVLEFRFGGKLPSVVTNVIDVSKLSWIEDTHIDLLANSATYTMTPVHYASFFTCTGTWEVKSTGPASSMRTITGTMKVNSPVPFVGGQVERAIVSGLKERLAEEPAVLEAWLEANP